MERLIEIGRSNISSIRRHVRHAPVDIPVSVVYGKLDTSKHEIRLLELHPCKDNLENIQSSVKQVSLNDHLIFKALSYA
jgi:hypothetical protein